MTAEQVISVSRAEHDTPCRRCDRLIQPGQRAVLVLGTGTVHLRCLLGRQADDTDHPAQGGEAQKGTTT